MSEITAIYENGILRPLTPLTFSEGQQVRLQILPESSSSTEQIDRVLELVAEPGLLTLPSRRADVPTISEAQLRELTKQPTNSFRKGYERRLLSKIEAICDCLLPR